MLQFFGSVHLRESFIYTWEAEIHNNLELSACTEDRTLKLFLTQLLFYELLLNLLFFQSKTLFPLFLDQKRHPNTPFHSLVCLLNLGANPPLFMISFLSELAEFLNFHNIFLQNQTYLPKC